MESVYALHLGTSDVGSIHVPYWVILLEWLLSRTTHLVLESNPSCRDSVREKIGPDGYIVDLQSPAPDMGVEAIAVYASSGAYKQIIDELWYTADGSVEYLKFYCDLQEICNVCIGDINIAILFIGDGEASQLASELLGLDVNSALCEENADEITQLVGDCTSWKALGGS